MNTHLLVTFEILLVIVAPLLVLYLRGPWRLRTAILCLISIPVLWYPFYAPLHELSHIAGTYLAMGRVVDYKLMPNFWAGEFGRAWIVTDGLRVDAQWLISTSFPYVLDFACIAAGYGVLRPRVSMRAFFVGFMFMLLCLRPAFDFVCETVAFLMGDRGDIFYIATFIGDATTWALLMLAFGFSMFTIVRVLQRFKKA